MIANWLFSTGKIIPFVPGIPGPNSLSGNAPLSPIISSVPPEKSERIFSPNHSVALYTNSLASFRSVNLSTVTSVVSSIHASRLSISPESSSPKMSTGKPSVSSEYNVPLIHAWPAPPNRDANQPSSEKSFNFMRIADNLSPPRVRLEISKSGDLEVSTTNLDKLKPRLKSQAQAPEVSPLHINIETIATEPSQINIRNIYESNMPEKIKMPQNMEPEKSNVMPSKLPPKFLRPCSLPLKPGTFTPKKHHGITPTANTLPLISPETPRPSKHCVQLYLNGHAYTYLGLKCSTKTSYCTVNRPQPVYAVFAGRPELSMYSNWQTCAENNPHPLGFSPKEVMGLYDSRQRTHNNHEGSKYTNSNKLSLVLLTASDKAGSLKIRDNSEDSMYIPTDYSEKMPKNLDESLEKISTQQNVSTVPGGYKSNEDYTYVRGRGRGRYVCIECGMRCIKPCTLKKHIRTVHSDVRPYTCQHCMFRYSTPSTVIPIKKLDNVLIHFSNHRSFKTKGNLTKHMESKAHYKKCVEKGINPHIPIEDSVNSDEVRSTSTTAGVNLSQGIEDCDIGSDDYSDGDDLEIESSGKHLILKFNDFFLDRQLFIANDFKSNESLSLDIFPYIDQIKHFFQFV